MVRTHVGISEITERSVRDNEVKEQMIWTILG